MIYADDDDVGCWRSIRKAIREFQRECVLARNDLGRYEFPQEYIGLT